MFGIPPSFPGFLRSAPGGASWRGFLNAVRSSLSPRFPASHSSHPLSRAGSQGALGSVGQAGGAGILVLLLTSRTTWVIYSIPLQLSFPVYKMGTMGPTSEGGVWPSQDRAC